VYHARFLLIRNLPGKRDNVPGSGAISCVERREFADLDIAELRKWVGKTETATDQVTPVPVAALAATLDLDAPPPRAGDALPPLWHWLYFLPIHRQSELSADGHAKRGGFLPPVPLPRRMWAGGRFEFHHPLRVGETITRASRIADIEQKQGRTGPLVFVVVRHEISNSAGLALSEEQDLVYRGLSNPGEPAPTHRPAPADSAWERDIRPDDVLLFRYSALTFNGHRIHYDRRFATDVEGYPGLVVHGPLIATLLMDLLRRHMPAARVARFTFRAGSPLFDTSSFSLCGKPEAGGKTVSLWAKTPDGGLATTATAEIL